MRRIVCLWLLLTAALVMSAQTRLTGRVTDSQSGKALAKVIISVKTADGKTKGYGQTKADGTYAVTTPVIDGCKLHFSMIGYKKKSVDIQAGQTDYHVTLQQTAIELQEVKVKARKIHQRGDTLIYHVATFAKDGDRSIGDVLKKMPGIQVAEDGKISYNGMPINKFYIEGKDLLQGRYGLATNGVEHKDVSSVEVMTNHQPVKALKNLSESEQAAINLKLKDGSKSHLITTINVAIGTPSLWNVNLTGMMFSKQWQMISTYKTNNTGEDLQRDIREHTSLLEAPRHHYSEAKYLSLPQGSKSELEQQRILFNKSHLLSTNWIFGIGRDATLDAQISYLTDRQHNDHELQSIYYLNDGIKTINDYQRNQSRRQDLTLKATIEVNRDSNYLNNVLRADMNWNSGDVLVSGSYNALQHLYLPHHKLNNSLEYIHRHGGNALTINSINQMEWLPQHTTVLRDVFGISQQLNRRSFYSDEHINYDWGLGSFVLAAEGGLSYLDRHMQYISTVRRSQLYVTPTLKFLQKNMSATLHLPLSYYHHDLNHSQRNDIYYGTSLSLSYRGIRNFTTSLTGSIAENPYNISNYYDGLLLSNYRTLTKGTTEYGTTTGKTITLTATYQNSAHAQFGFLTITRIWNKNPFVSIQSFLTDSLNYQGDWLVNGIMLSPNRSRSWLVNGNFETMLSPIGGMFRVFCHWMQYDQQMLSGDVMIPYRNTSFSLDAILNGTFFRKLNWKYELEYGTTRLSIGDDNPNSLKSFEHSFSLYYSPVKKLSLSILGEYYHNEIASHQYTDHFQIDTRVILKLRSNFELTLSLNNILNQRNYSYTTYTQLMSLSESHPIRGRELLLSIYFRP